MILDFGDYQIKSDERQFIVYRKKVTQLNNKTKPENIGKEFWEPEGYYTDLNHALKYIGRRVLLDNDDLSAVKERLELLEAQIAGFTKELEVKINGKNI
jgi:GTP:adenosylcobinamide-phosphate guanylyltransferase